MTRKNYVLSLLSELLLLQWDHNKIWLITMLKII